MCAQSATKKIVRSLVAAMLTLGMLVGFVPKNDGPALRRAASSLVLRPQPEDMPDVILPLGDGQRQWAVRERVFPSNPQVARLAAAERDAAVHTVGDGIVVLGGTGVRLVAGVSLTFLDDRPVGLDSLLAADAGSPRLLVNLPRMYGDALDAQGRPLRWDAGGAADWLHGDAASVSPRAVLRWLRREAERRAVESAIGGVPRAMAGARQYKELVEAFARRYNLSVDLVYAIIHSESNFSTTLVSSKSAAGLMQILPGTASGEVHRYLYGHAGSVSLEDLRDPSTNIQYGTTYLHILFNRYFSGVRDPQAREYCAVAGYNMGPNRVLRFFGPTREKAFAAINAMSPDALYNALVTSLPSRETRHYVAKVARMKESYSAGR